MIGMKYLRSLFIGNKAKNIENRSPEIKIRPIPLWMSSLFIVFPGILFYIVYYFAFPSLMEGTGYPFLIMYLIVWGGGECLLFFTSLLVFKFEGNRLSWKTFQTRYRLYRLDGIDWIWALSVLALAFVVYFGLTFTSQWLASMPLFAPPTYFPVELTPNATSILIPGVFMGMSIKGMWWIAAVYFIGYIFNILGEEFLFRGYVLPRQELAHKKYAFIINGIQFTLYHIFWKWNLLMILPSMIFSSYVMSRRKNTWIGVIQHGVMNFVPFIWITMGIIN
jgi:membrane protease YdiL (CAAX protease family)